MNKKTTFIILFISIINLKANAQYSIGLSSGLTINHFNYRALDNQVFATPGYGSTINLNLSRQWNNNFNIETGIGIVEKNYRLTNTVEIEQKISNQYLSIPITVGLKLPIIERFYFVISLGGYGSYWIHSSIAGKIPNVFDSTTDSENNTSFNLEQVKVNYNFRAIDNRLEGGILSRLSICRKITHLLNINAQYEIQYALNNQQRGNAFPNLAKRNITQLFNLGIILNIQ